MSNYKLILYTYETSTSKKYKTYNIILGYNNDIVIPLIYQNNKYKLYVYNKCNDDSIMNFYRLKKDNFKYIYPNNETADYKFLKYEIENINGDILKNLILCFKHKININIINYNKYIMLN